MNNRNILVALSICLFIFFGLHIDAQETTYSLLEFPNVTDVIWSPNGFQLAVVHSGSIDVLDSNTWQSLLTITNAEVSHVAWKPNGTQLASVSGGNPSSLYIWNASTGTVVQQLFAHFNGIEGGVFPMYELAWSPDGMLIASDSFASEVLLWNLETEEVAGLGSHDWGRVTSLEWNADSTQVASAGSDGTIHIWNIANGRSEMEIPGIRMVDWHSLSNRILTITQDDHVSVFDSDSGEELISFAEDSRILLAAWNFSGDLIATSAITDTINIWKIEGSYAEKIFSIEEISDIPIAMSWHPTQNILAIADYAGRVHIWNLMDL